MKTSLKVSLQTNFTRKGKEAGNTQGPGWGVCELTHARQVYKWVQCFSNSEGLCE